MTRKDFEDAIQYIRDESLNTLVTKNAKYANCSNPLHNFEAGAAMSQNTPAQTAWGYMTKHLVALSDMVQTDDFRDVKDLKEKCQDIINYIAFIFAIGCDENSKYCAVASDIAQPITSGYYHRSADGKLEEADNA